MAVLTQEIIDRALAMQSQAQQPSITEEIAQRQAAYEATRGNTWGETLGNVGPQLASGVVSVGQQAYGLANMASLGFLDRAVGLSDNFQQTQNILSQAQSAPTQRAAAEVNRAFDQDGIMAGLGAAATSPAFLQQALVGTLPSLLPVAAVARTASGIAGANALARGLGAKEAADQVEKYTERAVLGATGAQVGGGTNVDAINAIEQAGGSETQQQVGGLGAGLIAGIAAPAISRLTGAAALEGRAANLFGGTLPTTGTGATALGVARGTVAGAAREGTDEAGQSAVEQLAQNIVTPGAALMDGVGQQAAVGGLLGGILGGGLGGALSVNTPRQETPLKQDLRAAMAEANAAAGDPIRPTALGGQAESEQLVDIPLPDGNTVPGTEINMDAAPLPDPQTVLPPGSESIDIPDLNIEDVNVGDTPVPTQVVAPITEPVDMSAAPVPGLDTPLYEPDWRVPAGLPEVSGDFGDTTWKQRMAKELGLKGGSFNSESWKQFTAAAEASGYHPEDPASGEFLSQWAAQQMASASNSTPAFVERMAAAYPAASVEPAAAPVQPVAPVVDPLASDFQERGVWAEAAQEDNQDALAGLSGLVRSGVVSAQDAEVILRRAMLAAKAERERSVAGDYINEAVARLSGTGTYSDQVASTIEMFERGQRTGVNGLGPLDLQSLRLADGNPESIKSARQRVKRRNEAENAALAAAEKTEANVQAGATALAPLTPSQIATPGSPDFSNPTPFTVDQLIRQAMSNDPDLTESTATADAYIDAMMDTTNPADLDGVFAAAKNHTGWNKLTDAAKTEVADNFERLYARMEGGNPGKFDRAAEAVAPSEAMSAESLAELVATANRNKPANSAEIFAVPTVADFQAMTSQSAPQDAKGVFTDGRIYLIAENLKGPTDVAFTLAHERGHNGLAALLGDRLPAVVNRLWTNPTTRRRIQDKIKVLKLQGGPENGSVRRLAAEEVLADMFAAGEPVANDIITKTRAAIEQGFANLLGMGKLTMKNSEVDALLRDVGAVLNDASATVTRGGKHPGLEDLMADPAPWLTSSARFSRATADIDAIVNDATAEGGGTRRSLSDAVREATTAGVDLVRSAGTGTFRDKARGFALDATPLNQMANLYDNLFNGKLAQFARTKRAKESLHNKILTADKEVSYHGSRMTTSPVSTSGQWEAFRRNSPAKGAALDNLQQNSTLYRLFPDRTLEAQAKVNHAELGFTEAERAAAYRDVQRLWKAVGPEGQKLYRQSQAIYSDLWNQRFAALTKSVEEATGTSPYMLDVQGNPILNEAGKPQSSREFRAQLKSRIDSALTKMSQGPYSPLQRYGDYLVTVRAADGKIAWFSGHDTLEQASKMANDLRNGEFAGDGYRVASTLRQEHNFQLDGISQSTIDALTTSVDGLLPLKDNDKLRNDIREGLVEAYLQSLPQGAFLQHANARKNTRGATTDAFRAFNDYSVKASRNISSLTHDGDIDRQLTDMQKFVADKTATGTMSANDAVKLQRVVTAVRRQHAASMNFDRAPVADALSAGGFLWFLSSPSQLVINSLQTPMVTLPRMAATYGNGSAIRNIRTALAQFAKSRGDLRGEKSVLAADSTERKVLDELYNRGTLDFTLAHDMTGLANGEGAAMSGHWRKVMEVAGWSMQKSEVFNRQVTALAVAKAELARNPNIDFNTLADITEDAVYSTQFDYSQTNKPKVMQGPWRKVIFQFQQYRLNMLAMIGKDIRDSATGTKEEKASARRALAWTLGTQLALTGAAGTVLAPIVFGIADMFRDDDDLLDSRGEFLRFAPQWLSHGLLAGALDLNRVGANSLLDFGGEYAPKDATAKETFQYYVLANIGPWAGLGANLATGAEGLLEGDHLKAAKNLMPALFRDPYKTYFETQQGAKDMRGVVYYEPNMWDGLTGVFGLRSGSRRDAEELRGAAYEADKAMQTIKQRVTGKFVTAYATGDYDMLAEAQQQNIDLPPDMRVNPRSAIVNRVRSQQNADTYGFGNGRPPSQSVKEALGL